MANYWFRLNVSHTSAAEAFGVGWLALALETSQCIHAGATIETWLPYAVINSMLAVDASVTIWA